LGLTSTFIIEEPDNMKKWLATKKTDISRVDVFSRNEIFSQNEF